jgi:hypothetical protein
MTTELQAYASPAMQTLIKGKTLANPKGWNYGKNRTEKRLPCYLNGGFYIPNFSEMSFETINLQRQLNANE